MKEPLDWMKKAAASPDEGALRREVMAAARAYIAKRKAEEQEPAFRSAHLQADLRLGWNLATSILEELEAAGELVKKPQRDGNVWVPSPASQPVGRGYALPLSQREASALLRALEWSTCDVVRIRSKVLNPGDITILREVRSRLKGGPL